MAHCQIAAEFFDEVLPILRPRFSALFKLHDIPTDLPVGFGDVRIDGLGRPDLTGNIRPRNAAQQVCVRWLSCDFFTHFETSSLHFEGARESRPIPSVRSRFFQELLGFRRLPDSKGAKPSHLLNRSCETGCESSR